jgi:hypothetical protein
MGTVDTTSDNECEVFSGDICVCKKTNVCKESLSNYSSVRGCVHCAVTSFYTPKTLHISFPLRLVHLKFVLCLLHPVQVSQGCRAFLY